MQAKDLTGQMFGKWEVLERIYRKGKDRNRIYWKCLCNCCGREKEVEGYNLTHGKTKSCGNLNKDITGKRFGRLIVLSKTDNSPTKKKRTRWLCKCDCGKEVKVCTDELNNGDTQSCGCLQKEIMSNMCGENAPAWKGGRRITPQGYIQISSDNYPGERKRKTVLEHVAVMAIHLGRPLTPRESVHHKNGVRTDNRISNLELWSSTHHSGQRVSDMLKFCAEYLLKYKENSFSEDTKKDLKGVLDSVELEIDIGQQEISPDIKG